MRIELVGDSAVQVAFGAVADDATRRRVAAAAERLMAARLVGVLECVPGFTSVTIHYDPVLVTRPTSSARWLGRSLRRVLADLDGVPGGDGELVEIPVCYGGEFGPDLEGVAASSGLTAEEAVRLHAAGEYRVHLVGFVPGFPYLGGLDARLHTPRRESPRTAVPAGSVGIGGEHTGVYPVESPGGWQLIGRTPLRLFDAHRERPALLRAGDRVRFRAVDADAFRALEAGR
jgi:inhibitor of KinA